MFQKSKSLKVVPLLCGGISSLLGIAVLFGWYTQNAALIQVLPHFAPMQVNTALGFMLAGFGLISLIFKRLTLSKIFGSGCVFLGGVTLIQYIFGVNFGIDELLTDAHVMVKTTQAGRMAPSTALGFVLVGLTLIIGYRHRGILVSIATSVIVLAMLALGGYLTSVEGVYGWASLTRMAIHTASCFAVLGFGLVSLGVSNRNERNVDLWQMIPLTLSSIVLVLSLVSWYATKESAQIRNTEKFERLVSDTSEALIIRYNLYEQSLLGGVGVLSASDNVLRSEWKAYVNALEIERTLPGITGFGYITSVVADELPSFLQAIRSDNFPEFVNHPETTYSNKFIITYIEPEAPNEKAIGLDIGFESHRRKAAEYSRDYDVSALTQKITLVQDGEQTAGFLLLVPFYDTKSKLGTVGERREHFKGWVYAPFIASNFIQGLSNTNTGQLAFTIYDGADVNAESLIYESGSGLLDEKSFKTQTKLNLAGRQWTINWSATDQYVPVANQSLSTVVLILGILIAAILYLALIRLLRSKEIIAGEVEKQTRLLADSERRLQLVFDNAGEGILGLDLKGRITFANRAAQTLLGYTLKELLRQPHHDLIQHTHFDGTAYAATDSYIHATIQDGTPHTIDEEAFWHKNGDAIHVEYTSKLIKDDDGKKAGAVVIFRDIADRKAAEADIKQANAELEEFAYRTSHDLRSPLVSSITLLGIAETAIHADNKSKALASLSHTKGSLKKLENLVKDILVLTQTKNEVEEDLAIDLSALVDGALDKFRYMDNFDRLNIDLDLGFSDVLVAKKGRVSLIIENLISNAVKYQDLNKDKSTLKISTYKSQGRFVLVVEDNGLGVPKDEQHNLFKMFKRFHPRTSFGSGLGLYMMQKSASILGGEIVFEDPGDGSLFKFSMPITA